MPLFGFTNVAGSVITQTSVAIAQGTDADAQAFIDAASITDSTEISAVNQLVLDLKGYGVWDKCKAIYPILGGSASSHAVNLKTPGTYNLTFATGMTHSSTGMVSNGSSGYGNTNFTPSVHAPSSQDNVHISIYSRTNQQDANWDIGVAALLLSQAQYLGMFLRLTGNLFYPLANVPQSGVAGANVANTDSRGLFIANRTASNSLKGFRNNVKLLDNATASQTILNIPLFIGALNNGGAPANYSTREISFCSIGDGLDDTESANFNTAVQAFQTTLSRNV